MIRCPVVAGGLVYTLAFLKAHIIVATSIV